MPRWGATSARRPPTGRSRANRSFLLREVVLTLILFAAFCALLYLCLSHVTLDELDEELAAAEVAAAAAAAAPRSKYQHATANSYSGWW